MPTSGCAGKLEEASAKLGAKVYYPRPAYCTDNGAMIAFAGALRLQAGQADDLRLQIQPRWPLANLDEIAS